MQRIVQEILSFTCIHIDSPANTVFFIKSLLPNNLTLKYIKVEFTKEKVFNSKYIL